MSVKNKLSIYKEFTLHLSTLYSVTLKMSSMSKAPSTVHYKQSLPSTRIVEEENRLSSERARVKIPRDGRYSLTPSLKEKGAARDFFLFCFRPPENQLSPFSKIHRSLLRCTRLQFYASAFQGVRSKIPNYRVNFSRHLQVDVSTNCLQKTLYVSKYIFSEIFLRRTRATNCLNKRSAHKRSVFSEGVINGGVQHREVPQQTYKMEKYQLKKKFLCLS